MSQHCPPGYGSPPFPPNAGFGPGSIGNERQWAPGRDAGHRFAAPLGEQQISGLPSWDRCFKVTGLASIPLSSEGTAVTFTWATGLSGGYCVGWRAHALGIGDNASLASLAIRLTVGTEDLAVTAAQQGADYATLMNLMGANFLPVNFLRQVTSGEQWTIRFRNFSTTTAYIPEMEFFYRSTVFPLDRIEARPQY